VGSRGAWGSQGRDEDLVHLYLRDLGRHPLLSKDQEADLARTIETGVAARGPASAPRPQPHQC